jgi:hypothetical protein
MNLPRISLTLLLVAASPFAGAQILRCTDAAGRVTYQQIPCAAQQEARATNIPTEYPAPNGGERDRLFAREADLERRLEARRERESRESAMRMASAAAQPREEPQAAEGYPVYYPAGVLHRVPHRFGPHPAPRRPSTLQR